MPSLVIVESPAKAKTIANFLGKKYIVEASMGHVRDLPAGKKDVPEQFRSESWADFAVNIDKNYEPIYIVVAEKRKKETISKLKAALKEADELLLATDEDREGESISWHLLEVLKPKKGVSIRRIVFHEITREAIIAALESPRDLDMNLVHAQEARRIVDRLFGYKLSPVLWRKVAPGLSAGRVQSVAVRLLVEREEERRSFRASEFWDLEADINSAKGIFKATLASLGGKRVASGKDFDPATGELKNKNAVLVGQKEAGDLARSLRAGLPWQVSKVEEKPGQQAPSPPFTTSTLQQEANRKLGLSAKRVMQVAQSLYEGVDLGGGERVGLITYMRTDSVTLSDKALKEGQSVIRQMYGAEYARGPRQYKTKTRNAQEAHEAIRPTEMGRKPQDVARYLDKQELAVYELIWKRTIASQMPNADVLRTSVEITAKAGSQQAVFTTSGKKIIFPGYLRAYVEGSDDPTAELGDQETILPDLQPGQKVLDEAAGKLAAIDDRERTLFLAKLESKKHQTQPPARYTEAALVKKLEEEGIGRPSTYASIISTIQDRGYCFVNKSRQLVPTFTAMVVTNLLREHFGHYVDYKFTARMEEELDQIANGEIAWEKHVDEFYRGNGQDGGLESLVDEKKETLRFASISLGIDPETNQPVQVRVGKYGPYISRGENGAASMANIPSDMAPADLTIDEAIRLLNQKAEGPRVVGTHPESGEKIYAMTGRFGDYVQLGENPEEKGAEKPRRQSLNPGQKIETITLEEALRLLAFPRELGQHPETKETIIVNKGKYGPYVQHGKEFRSLKPEDDPETVDLERALALLAEPKGVRGSRGAGGASKSVIKDLGEEGGRKIRVLAGRYGPYVTDGETNATLPKSKAPEELTLDEARKLLEEKAAAGPKKKPARKGGGKKKG